MQLVYEQLSFPFQQTVFQHNHSQKHFFIQNTGTNEAIQITIDDELILLEFAKSIQTICSYAQDFKKENYIFTTIDLKMMIAEFNARYKTVAKVIKVS